MAGFGAGLGAFGSGMLQGENQAAQIRQRMQQIQQMQAALDQAKKQTAAQALMFQTFSQQNPQLAQGGQPGSSTLPPSAGGIASGSSPPAPTPMSPLSTQPQRSPWAGNMSIPQQNPMQAPQGPQAPMPAAGTSPQTMVDPRNHIQSLVTLLNSGRLDPQNIISMLAQRIKQAKPDADPQTQAMALAAAVDMMKGVEPAAKAQIDAIVNATVRPFQAMQSAGAREYAADMAAETARFRIADLDSRFDRVQQRLKEQFRMKQISLAEYRVRTERRNILIQQRIAAGQELAAAQNNNDDDAAAAAAKKLEAVDTKLQNLEMASGDSGSQSTKPDAPSQPAAADPSWPSAKGQKDGAKLKDAAGDIVAVAKNGKWIPVKGVP